ncbi:MAG TPA: hypothetical protein VFA20_08535 [Myxococcaceae bacterium]|nr:hypothetical protein [Myxococcaceae bacterium]
MGMASLLLALLGTAPPQVDRVQVISGAFTCFASKRCQQVSETTAGVLHWPGLIYSRAPPKWGDRPFVDCSGADTFVLQESLATGALWATGDQAELQAKPMETLFDDQKIRAAFRAAFGWSLPADPESLGPSAMPKYDARQLKQLLERLWVKPADQVGAFTAQQLYDLALRKRLERIARDVAFINANVPKAKLAKLLKDYKAAIQEQGGGFSGPRHLQLVAAEVLPQDQEPASARNGQTLGLILRRMNDGSWPTVVALLKKILAEYDPELFKEVGAKL